MEKIEYLTIKNSNFVITVSKTMENQIKNICKKTNIKNIYLIGSVEKVTFSKKKRGHKSGNNSILKINLQSYTQDHLEQIYGTIFIIMQN